MIPKKIHYVWIGDYANIPDIEKKWRETTEKNHPDYEIKVWSEKDIPSNQFLESCLEQKLYAAASDYIRCWVLYNEGGFYLDTDVELIKSIPTEWTNFDLILPKETNFAISSYIIGSIKKSRFLKKLLEVYNSVIEPKTIVVDDWMPPKLWESYLESTYGKYSVPTHHDGAFISTNKVKILTYEEGCSFYPWDEFRSEEEVDITNSVCVHYWNNYMKESNLELGTFQTKYFDEQE